LEVIAKLKAENVKIYSIEQTENAIMLDDFQPETESKYALIFGNEVKGVSQEAINLSEGVIEIPQLGSKHSLNISVSAGIVIWDLFQKLK
jgi:23S rRNA (guanosine2251-2'-O)-methyltransferase